MRTFRYLRALNRLVIHGPGSLLKQFVTLNAQLEDASALDAALDELLHDVVHNVGRSLRKANPKEVRIQIVLNVFIKKTRQSKMKRAEFIA